LLAPWGINNRKPGEAAYKAFGKERKHGQASGIIKVRRDTELFRRQNKPPVKASSNKPCGSAYDASGIITSKHVYLF